MASDDRILLISTGGTFESEAYSDRNHPPSTVTTLQGEASPLRGVVEKLDRAGRVDIHRWSPGQEANFNKDSKKFDIGDIKALAAMIREDKHRCFVLTHGTDHLALNAEMLQKEMKELGVTDKTVVLVGAMVPLSMEGSDGIPALEFVLSRIGMQKPGVYASGRDAETGIRGFFDPSVTEKDWDKSKASLHYTLGKSLDRNNKSYETLSLG